MKQQLYFTPGPSQMYPTVESHVKNAFTEGIPSLSHRSKAFEKMYQEAKENLFELLDVSAEYQILFTTSATAIWDILSLNAIEKKGAHMVNGSFSQRFFETTLEWGKQSRSISISEGESFSVVDLKTAPDEEILGLILNETSTGVSMPSSFISEIRHQSPHALIVADGVSAFPHYKIDFKCIDAAYFSVQKGFGLPAGLGVLLAGPALIEKAQTLKAKGGITGSYLSLPGMVSKSKGFQTNETPNVLGIYLFGKVLQDMLEKGIASTRSETAEKAAMMYNFLERNKNFSAFVQDPEFRSETVIVANVESGSAALIERLSSKGFILASGYGKFKDSQIRIANFPSVSVDSMSKLIQELPFIR